MNSDSQITQLPNYSITKSVFNPSLRDHALFVGVFYLAHFGDGVRKLDNCRMRVASRQDNMNPPWLFLQSGGDLGRIKHAITDGVIDVVDNHCIPFAGLECALPLSPGIFYHA